MFADCLLAVVVLSMKPARGITQLDIHSLTIQNILMHGAAVFATFHAIYTSGCETLALQLQHAQLGSPGSHFWRLQDETIRLAFAK